MGALTALPGNPFGVELRFFGASDGVACKVRHPLLRGKNRILGFSPNDAPLLEELLNFYRAEGLRPSLFVPHGAMTHQLFQTLVRAGLWSAGSGTVPAIVGASRTRRRWGAI